MGSDYVIPDLIQQMGQQILSAHPALDQIVLVGILSSGYPLAQRLAFFLEKETGTPVQVGKLDVALYRDDLFSRQDFVTLRESDIPFSIAEKILILVDDVLFHGRTIRAALNALLDFGRPRAIELAVLIDRGHRQLPIFAHYCGKQIQTSPDDHVQVQLYEIDGDDKIILERK